MNNYHTHTYLCRHAEGAVIEYAETAETRGLKILGMSDHTPLPDRRWPAVRMSIEELDQYEAQIETARAAVTHLQILKGLECEWHPDYRGFYHDEILTERNFDYLIGAEHWFPYRGEWHDLGEIRTAAHLKAYADLLIETMASGLFAFIAHPDAFGTGYTEWDENSRAASIDILQAASELQIPLEINGYGFRKPFVSASQGRRRRYPLREFWELAATYPIQAICNSDAHTPGDVDASIDLGRELAMEVGIPVLEELPVQELSKSIPK